MNLLLPHQAGSGIQATLFSIIEQVPSSQRVILPVLVRNLVVNTRSVTHLLSHHFHLGPNGSLMRYLLLILLIGCHCGCESLLKSRYAMDDPIYALKYGEGAERGDLLGKAKQAMDARHTEGLWGNYFSGGAQVRPDSSTAMGGAELGAEGHATSWLTGRAALAIYGAHNEGYAGGDVGVRIQTPSRIAPFVGIGTFQGFSRGVELADDDWLDNDDDGWIDEKGEKDVFCDGYLATIYPEVGVHAWLNGNWRITSYGRYLITSEGRDYDDWLIGLQVTGFRR